MPATTLRRAVVVTIAGAALAVASPLAASAAGSAAPHAAGVSASSVSASGVSESGVSESNVSASAKHAQVRLVVRSGATVLTLSPATAAALTKAGVAVAPTGEARVVKTGISFPVTGGLLNPANLAGTIRHNGGLTFTAGGKTLTVRDFLINTGAGKLTAYVDEAKVRIPLLDLGLGKATVTSHGNTVVVGNVTATLDKVAASALNGYFSTKLFAGGLPIGVAKASVQATKVTLG